MQDSNKTKNVSSTSKGLDTNTARQFQPRDTYTFALNAVNLGVDGDVLMLSTEQSNEPISNMKEGFTPVGHVYKNNGEMIIFSVSKDNVSEIGILRNNGDYETVIDDEDSEEYDKLNFSKNSLIKALYRLRRGCEDVVYFFEKRNKPRYFNLNKPEEFKNVLGKTSSKLFNLFKTYDRIPYFSKVSVSDSGGSLLPGSYNVAIQYLDKGLNPTEWITTSKIIYIYNSMSENEYLDISGSVNSEEDYLNFGATSKSIVVEIGNLDTSFDYYRLALIAANSGTGLTNSITYTDIISTNRNHFTFTGDNASTIGTEAEIQMFNYVIDRVGYVEQKDNTLILGETEGKQIDYCSLQKYASRIKADCVVKKISLNNVKDPFNSKNPTHEFGDMISGGVGYMPGEIYSFGIVYVFADGSTSPVFHIPGKSPTLGVTAKFNEGFQYYPMAKNNESKTNTYLDTNSCGDENYWGQDSEGNYLRNRPVRHHRFPLRGDLGIPMMEVAESTGEVSTDYYQLEIKAHGILELPCTQEMVDDEDDPCTAIKNAPSFIVKVEYTVDGTMAEFDFSIDPDLYIGGDGNITEFFRSNMYTSNNIELVSITESVDGVNFAEPTKLNYDDSIVSTEQLSQSKSYVGNLLGINFSGIDMPSLEDTNGEEVVGYYIVRQERTEQEKTILDTCVLNPSIENDKYISHGLLCPEFNLNDTHWEEGEWGTVKSKINTKMYGLIHPEHKFNNKEYTSYDWLKQQGSFQVVSAYKSNVIYNDVQEGSSYNSKAHKAGNDDGGKYNEMDGWCLDLIVRDNIVEYREDYRYTVTADQISDRFYLDAVASKDLEGGKKVAYNITTDNKVGIVYMKEENVIDHRWTTLPYMVMGRNIADSYANFRILPYYSESLRIERFNEQGKSSVNLFSGDSYISPMRYVNTVFYDNRIADRAGRTSIAKKIIGAVIAVVGVVLAFWTGGSSLYLTGLGVAMIGAGTLLVSSGIKLDNILKAYQDEYERGLRETALDHWVQRTFGKNNARWKGRSGPSDDSIQWIGEAITDLWFDTTVNTSLRNRIVNDHSPSFLPSPGKIETGNNTDRRVWEYFGKYWLVSDPSRYPISKLEYHLISKLLVFDPENDDAKRYLGFALGEYYNINPDYKRRNTQKTFFHLPAEYDCCSDCGESFPHRIHYSEQSFQEELTDNYRVFLPNNYIDIPGETGRITNLFKYNNTLYVHTEEALWMLPNNHQERVTDQIVSFIGTGDFFSVPPRKIIDSRTGMSAGTTHSNSMVVTPYGVMFVSERERNVYLMNSEGLSVINNNISNWMSDNLLLKTEEDYYKYKKEIFQFRDNTVTDLGVGFVTAYDDRNKRILLTKIDYILNEDFIKNTNFIITSDNSNNYIFTNVNETIAEMSEDGWYFEGVFGSQLMFSKNTTERIPEIRYYRNQNGGQSEEYIQVQRVKKIFTFLDGDVVNKEDIFKYNNSWTLSYSFLMGLNNWVSFHSYLPNLYMFNQSKFFSWRQNTTAIWKHNVPHNYSNFYGKVYPFVIDYTSNGENSLVNKTYDALQIKLNTSKYDEVVEDYVETDNFFDKVIFYNNTQCSGLLGITKRENDSVEYLQKAVLFSPGNIVASKLEDTWRINEIRDYRVNYKVPIFDKSLHSRQDDYFIDKVINDSSIDFNKHWTQLEPLRSNFMGIRFSYLNLSNERFIFYFSIEDEDLSLR